LKSFGMNRNYFKLEDYLNLWTNVAIIRQLLQPSPSESVNDVIDVNDVTNGDKTESKRIKLSQTLETLLENVADLNPIQY